MRRRLEQLTRFPPARLAIACDPRRSPDRGSLALIAELARSVTLAAERLFVTQPSVSYGLARLRELFDDKLFSRTRDGIQPTFVAQQLYPTLRDCLTRIEGAVQSTRQFDPATTERRFRIALSDLGEMGFLSLILARLNREAPRPPFGLRPRAIGCHSVLVREW